MSMLNTFMADTAGVVYRAGTGKVDPWTQQELIDQATAAYTQAGMDPTMAATQAATDIQTTAASSNVSWLDAAKTTFGSAFTDNGSGCGIVNLGGCVPPWIVWVAIAGGAILLLWVLRPYVEIFNER